MPHPLVYPPPASIEGLPTQEELDAFPRLFSWDRLKAIIASDELGDLKRNIELQQRYDEWTKGIKKQYGTTENYLLSVRLPWGNTQGEDKHAATSSSTPSTTDVSSAKKTPLDISIDLFKLMKGRMDNHLPDTPSITPGGGARKGGHTGEGESEGNNYLKFKLGQDLDSDMFAILPNDWPYNVPYGVTHTVVWSKLPIFHPALVSNDSTKWAKILQEGFAGRTGSPPEDAIDVYGGDWFTEGGQEVDAMVRMLWSVDEFECLWFVNPPRLQSVRGLSHFHVFARNKTH